MSQKRKELKPNLLVDAYIKRSQELDQRLAEIGNEIEAHNTRVEQRNELSQRLDELDELIDNTKLEVEALKPLFVEASFQQDHTALTDIDGRRAQLQEEVENYKTEQYEVQQAMDAIVIDAVAIAELCAELDGGIRSPDFREFLKVLEQDCKARASKQDKQLKALRSEVPARYKDQQTYDAARKQLDSSYRTSEESKRAAERIQAQREEERRRFNEHTPRSSEEVRREKDRQLALANSSPVEVHQW